ncbi:hypothetical protein BJ742DRAFT_668909, partial [Cladochytrium replicatum]
EYSEKAIKNATRNGHIHVLDWWKSSSLELKYSPWETIYVSDNGLIDVLEWWKAMGLTSNAPLSQSGVQARMGMSVINGHVEVLEWWKLTGRQLRYYADAIDGASIYDHINVLEWWKLCGLELIYSERSMDFSSVDVLDWWKASALPMKW